MLKYSPPRLRTVLLVFLIVGPMMALWSVLAVADIEKSRWTVASGPFGLFMSALNSPIWYVTPLIRPPDILITWIPTVLAAMAYWYTMRRLNDRFANVLGSKPLWICTSVVVSIVVSSIIFFACQFISNSLFPSPISKSGDDQIQVIAVALIGAIVGLIIGALKRTLADL